MKLMAPPDDGKAAGNATIFSTGRALGSDLVAGVAEFIAPVPVE